MNKTFAVYLEICDVVDRLTAENLAIKIKHRFDDLKLKVNICISEYEEVDNPLMRTTPPTISITNISSSEKTNI